MITIYRQIPFYDDCIAVLHGCECFELLVNGDFYDEYEEPFIVFAGVDVEEVNEYLLFAKQKVACMTKVYGKYADFEIKPIFVFKELYMAQWFLRIYERKEDKKEFVANLKRQFNSSYGATEIKEQYLMEIDENNRAINLFED